MSTRGTKRYRIEITNLLYLNSANCLVHPRMGLIAEPITSICLALLMSTTKTNDTNPSQKKMQR